MTAQFSRLSTRRMKDKMCHGVVQKNILAQEVA